jgi:hypothetical protein
MWSAKPSSGDRDKWNTVRVVSTGPRTSEPICESTCGNGERGRKRMGRPSKGKPWIEAGVSKASWYRQQKSAKPSEGKGDV